mgnify:CR=1 FL=1
MAYPEKVEVLCQGEVIACHERSYGQNQDILDPTHYIPLLERRPALLHHGKAFREWKLPEIFERAQRRLQEKSLRGAREYIRILRLHERHTTDQIASALKQAEEIGGATPARCLGADEVEMLLAKSAERATVRRECSLTMDNELAKLRVQPVDLQRYNALMEVCV